MPTHPVHFQLPPLPESPAIQAAARRRLRGMERAYPAVQEWEIAVQPPAPRGEEGPGFAAGVKVRVAGGSMLRAEARSGDALAALRLALNALELALEAERQRARTRAAQWLSLVKRRLGQDTRLG